jgi:integrase
LTLAELNDARDDVRKWHERLTDGVGAVTANKCVKLVRATYRHAAKNIRGLPPELPTSAVKLNDEDRPDLGMTPAQFRKWADAWRQIESPSRKAYQLLACLAGPRPGELARLKVTDLNFAEHRFTIRKAKKSNDILIPISKPIERALRMALKARGDDESDWLFPAREGGTSNVLTVTACRCRATDFGTITERSPRSCRLTKCFAIFCRDMRPKV